MFDGLDEVTDYKEQVIDLIDALIKAIRIKKILITTRNHLREELEDNFRTFAFDLNNFDDDDDQRNFFDLYNQFIESKINIQFEKSGIKIERNQELFGDEKVKFFANHIKLSSSILFESNTNKEDNNL